jgi:hypothetical protein
MIYTCNISNNIVETFTIDHWGTSLPLFDIIDNKYVMMEAYQSKIGLSLDQSTRELHLLRLVIL